MHFILLSVLCSVAVSVLLKLAPRFRIDIRQAIAGNYLVAAALTMLLLDPQPRLLELPATHPAWRVLVALGVLLPSIFAALAVSVRRVGVVRTDAAQRLSLLLPLLAAFTLFGEALSWQKGIGIGMGLTAILCIVLRETRGQSALSFSSANRSAMRRAEKVHSDPGFFLWPLLVFVGMGAIDVLFKRVAQLTGVPFADVLLATFVLAFVLSALAVGWLYLRGRARADWRHAVGALLLGALNFGNIVFYIQAHRALASDPALVFSAMNIGVIVLATLVGVWLFRERLGLWNRVGLGLAVVAVVILAMA